MEDKPRPDTHRTNRLLFAMERDDFAYLVPYLEVVRLRAGQTLYETGDTLEYAYFPHDVVISLVAMMENGSTVEMAGCGREGVVGLIPATATRQSYGNYIVQMAGTASRICLSQMQEAIKARSGIAQLIHHFAEAMNARILQSVACNAVHNVEGRMCRWILSARHRTERVVLPLTHEILAERLGVQRSTITATMGKLQAAGVIQQVRGGITITDGAQLEQTACECYRKMRSIFEHLLPHTFSENNIS